ncbi:MAG: nuclear transport factor 2 family protein [Gemmatimonadota bacterium]|jgi:hypothetical protein
MAACEPVQDSLDRSQKEILTAEVLESLTGLTTAMNAHDPDQVFEYYRQNEDFLYLGCTDLMAGWETFSPRASSYYMANPLVTFQRETVHVQILSPAVAVATLRGSSSEVEALFWTQVLVKEEGTWRIAHEHESWPGCSPPSGSHPLTSPADTVGLGAGEEDPQGSGGV